MTALMPYEAEPTTPMSRPIPIAADTGAQVVMQGNGETVWIRIDTPHGSTEVFADRVAFGAAVGRMRFDVLDQFALPPVVDASKGLLWFEGEHVAVDTRHQTAADMREKAARLLSAALWMEGQE